MINTSPHAEPRVRAVLVDDHALIRQGLRSLLESSGRVAVVGEAGDVAEALVVVGRAMPDVIVLDLRLGEEDSVGAVGDFKAAAPGARVLVLSAHGSSQQLRAAISAGADGYLLKGISAPELVEGICRTVAGHTVIDPEFVPRLIANIASGETEELLSMREIEVLRLVADGLTASAVAHRLSISVRTVQKHLENMHRKLDVASRAELVSEAFRRGLLT